MNKKQSFLTASGVVFGIVSLVSIFIVVSLLLNGTNVDSVVFKDKFEAKNAVVSGLSEKDEVTIKVNEASHILVVDKDGLTLITPTKAYPFDKKDLHQSYNEDIKNGLMQIITGSDNANASHCADVHRQCSGTYIDGRGYSVPYCWCR